MKTIKLEHKTDQLQTLKNGGLLDIEIAENICMQTTSKRYGILTNRQKKLKILQDQLIILLYCLYLKNGF
jgi:hypothetical protein